jgi:hypothetical protein
MTTYTPINKYATKLTTNDVEVVFNTTLLNANIIMEEDSAWLLEEDEHLIYEERYYG